MTHIRLLGEDPAGAPPELPPLPQFILPKEGQTYHTLLDAVSAAFRAAGSLTRDSLGLPGGAYVGLEAGFTILQSGGDYTFVGPVVGSESGITGMAQFNDLGRFLASHPEWAYADVVGAGHSHGNDAKPGYEHFSGEPGYMPERGGGDVEAYRAAAARYGNPQFLGFLQTPTGAVKAVAPNGQVTTLRSGRGGFQRQTLFNAMRLSAAPGRVIPGEGPTGGAAPRQTSTNSSGTDTSVSDRPSDDSTDEGSWSEKHSIPGGWVITTGPTPLPPLPPEGLPIGSGAAAPGEGTETSTDAEGDASGADASGTDEAVAGAENQPQGAPEASDDEGDSSGATTVATDNPEDDGGEEPVRTVFLPTVDQRIAMTVGAAGDAFAGPLTPGGPTDSGWHGSNWTPFQAGMGARDSTLQRTRQYSAVELAMMGLLNQTGSNATDNSGQIPFRPKNDEERAQPSEFAGNLVYRPDPDDPNSPSNPYSRNFRATFAPNAANSARATRAGRST